MRGVKRRAAAALGLALVGMLLLSLDGHRARADWTTAPVVPELNPAIARAIAATRRRGAARARHPNVFAKVGDSISRTPSFLEGLGCGEWRPGRHSALRSTVGYFGSGRLRGASSQCSRRVNSFSRDSAATRPSI